MRIISQFRKKIPHSLVNQLVHLPKAVVANFYYGRPAHRLRVIGVTGTDGKTTTVNMIYQILRRAGKQVSMVSTIHAAVAGNELDTGLHTTTPTAFALQRLIKVAADNGDEFLVLEVTSHAIAQFRTWGIPFEIGVITNVTQEHLDYHRTFEEYFWTKIKLLKSSQIAICNLDEANIAAILPKLTSKVITYGHQAAADLNPKIFPLKLKVPGKHNLANALAAAAACQQLGIEDKIIQASLESFTSLEGRLEEVPNSLDIRVFVDFAHTPNSIKQVLTTLRKLGEQDGGSKKGSVGKQSRVIALFGASAERDEEKRPVMGKAAAALADVIILTDDDPRHEDRMSILRQIAQGIVKHDLREGKTLFYIPDRDLAIQQALKIAKPGDIIGLLGKGHEKSMSYLGVEYPWSDKKVVEEFIKLGEQVGKSSYHYSGLVAK
jgi:UDP-N-acetylmuramoyl-L-alanyl-D-glutamate--2,6-diaminopimelate ligase